ncbi:MAG: stage II sporulation protein M, partial [Pirellulaceae bacterium]|nr:stage II sporulation protein M [Pirellulaceae bacterium]
YTGGLTRFASLQKTGRDAIPIMGAAIVMFFLAAMIEGFLSPSAAPYWLKATVAVLSSGMLTFYFVVLGLPREVFRAT